MTPARVRRIFSGMQLLPSEVVQTALNTTAREDIHFCMRASVGVLKTADFDGHLTANITRVLIVPRNPKAKSGDKSAVMSAGRTVYAALHAAHPNVKFAAHVSWRPRGRYGRNGDFTSPTWICVIEAAA